MYMAQIGSLTTSQVIETYTPVKPELKWVNDVFFLGKKIGGILPQTEMIGKNCYLSLGIGVNLNHNPSGLDEEHFTCLYSEIWSEIEVSLFIEKLTQ